MKLYPQKPIQSIESLAAALRVPKDLLLKVVQNPDQYYREFHIGKRKLYNIKEPLKSIQKRIKMNILDRIEYPAFLYGGISRRSAADCAKVHLNKKVLIHSDVKNFFPSVTDKQIFNIWKYHFHFSKEVSEILTQLTTYKGELPQGSSTSSHLANLVLLVGGDEVDLYEKLKAAGYEYTRYMDDIVVGSMRNITPREKTLIIRIVERFIKSKGFKINSKKIIVQGSQKQKGMLGYVLGGKENLKKPKEYSDKLIHDYKKGNLSEQSLEGKIRHIEYVDPKRANKIRKAIGISLP